MHHLSLDKEAKQNLKTKLIFSPKSMFIRHFLCYFEKDKTPDILIEWEIESNVHRLQIDLSEKRMNLIFYK